MKINKIEIVAPQNYVEPAVYDDDGTEITPSEAKVSPASLQLRFVDDAGKYFRSCIALDGSEILNTPELVAAGRVAATTVPEGFITRVDFEFSKIKDTEGQEVYGNRAFKVCAKTRNKKALIVAPCYKDKDCWHDTDPSELPTEMQVACNEFFNIEKNGVKKHKRLFQIKEELKQ